MTLFSRERKKRKFRMGAPLSAIYIGALLLNIIGLQGAIAEDSIIE